MSASRELPAPVAEPHAQRELLRAIAALRFGTVEVTVHDGRIVQIERREKIRLGGNPVAQHSSIPSSHPAADRTTGSSQLTK